MDPDTTGTNGNDGIGIAENDNGSGTKPKTSTRKSRSTRSKPRTDTVPRKRAKTQDSTPGVDPETNPEENYLTEDEIDLLLNELPEAQDTPIPQLPIGDFTSASIICSLLDGVVTMSMGAAYAMTKEERKMIAEPLDRIMARFPTAQLARYGQFVDPLLLLMGLISWGSRISRLKREESKGSGKPTPPPTKSTPPTAGAVPNNISQPTNLEAMGVPASISSFMGTDL